jgi:hypothetical protein
LGLGVAMANSASKPSCEQTGAISRPNPDETTIPARIAVLGSTQALKSRLTLTETDRVLPSTCPSLLDSIIIPISLPLPFSTSRLTSCQTSSIERVADPDRMTCSCSTLRYATPEAVLSSRASPRDRQVPDRVCFPVIGSKHVTDLKPGRRPSPSTTRASRLSTALDPAEFCPASPLVDPPSSSVSNESEGVPPNSRDVVKTVCTSVHTIGAAMILVIVVPEPESPILVPMSKSNVPDPPPDLPL